MVLDGFTIRGGNGWLTFDFSDIGSLYLKNYDANIRYLKIHDNHYDGFAETGGIFVTNTSSPYFKDILLFDNSSYLGTYWLRAGGPGQFDPVRQLLKMLPFSNIQGGWEGEGNINSDPLFTDSENGDFTPQPNSP